MKRVDLIRHIEANGCAFLREGGRHTVYFNPTSRRRSAATLAFQRRASPVKRENKAVDQTADRTHRRGCADGPPLISFPVMAYCELRYLKHRRW
jgi:hypothetical protein